MWGTSCRPIPNTTAQTMNRNANRNLPFGLVILLRSALSSEGPSGLGRLMSRPTAKFVFGFLFLAWAVVFGIGLQLVPHAGANSPYGGIGLIALFSGFFIMMGFLWAVIGE